MDGAAVGFAHIVVSLVVDDVRDVTGEGERQVVGDRVVQLDQVALEVGAAIDAGAAAAAGRILIVSCVVVVHHLVIPGIGFEVFVAIAQVPGVFFAGLAERHAGPVTVVVLARAGVVDVFAGHLDREFAGVKRGLVERIGQARVGNYGVVIVEQD